MDTEVKKFIGSPWALRGDRQLPEDFDLSRATGWPVRYEQVGAASEPERELFNQLLFELHEAFEESVVCGVPRWDDQINYPGSEEEGYAFVTAPSGGLYVSVAPSGPATGNSTNPDEDSGDFWEEY